jgi:hypothetical protein
MKPNILLIVSVSGLLIAGCAAPGLPHQPLFGSPPSSGRVESDPPRPAIEPMRPAADAALQSFPREYHVTPTWTASPGGREARPDTIFEAGMGIELPAAAAAPGDGRHAAALSAAEFDSPLATPPDSPLATPPDSPLPTPTDWPFPSPSAAPATPTDLPAMTPTRWGTATPTRTGSPTITRTPTITGTPSRTLTPMVSATPWPSPTIGVPTRTPTRFSVPTPTSTAAPTEEVPTETSPDSPLPTPAPPDSPLPTPAWPDSPLPTP